LRFPTFEPGSVLDLETSSLPAFIPPTDDCDAELITDGMLIPLQSDGIRGTIWRGMRGWGGLRLAWLPAVFRLIRLFAIDLCEAANERQNRRTARAEASPERAHTLAHQIKNPAQSLTNILYLASKGGPLLRHCENRIEANRRSLRTGVEASGTNGEQ
jgi:hypothetical protein